MADNKVNSIITEKFIAKVNDTGKLPWSQPWTMIDNCNYQSKHIYTGVNRWMTALSDYACPYWLSYKKVIELGGSFKEEEAKNPTAIVFAKIAKKNAKYVVEGKSDSYRMFRYYGAYNLEQTTLEIPADEQSKLALLDVHQFLNTGNIPTIKHGDARAFYAPSQDKIHLPYLNTFSSEDSYFATLFHELVHATGHHSRLDRSAIFSEADMKKESYSYEELVAEIGAALLCKLTGKFNREVEDNSIAYLQGWKSKLSSNTDWLVSAASKAEKAVNYLIGKEVTYAKKD
jgi:antirestriction protein ArdC